MKEVFVPKLHRAQADVWTAGSQHQYNVVRCGRRWGKTEFLVILAVSYVTSLFPQTGTGKLEGGRVGIFTAEYKQQFEIFDKLSEILQPLIKRKSRSDGIIRLKNGARIDFWVTNNNPLAGRGREYDLVLIDEAAFTKIIEMLNEVWPKSIKPTLLTRRGRAWVFSTPNGIDENNFFYAICHNKTLGFHEHHAPTSSNPYVPADELEKERKANDPRVFQQEFLAEFVDWSNDAFFDFDKLLVDGLPVDYPTTCDGVFAVMDTAVKGGTSHDGTGITYYAYEQTYGPKRAVILDYELLQIDGALLELHVPNVFSRLEQLAKECKARHGSLGLFIEDASTGSILLQKGKNNDWPVHSIDSVLTSKGKDERAIMCSGYHFQGLMKISHYAFNKVVTFKTVTANHLIKQIKAFHLADKDAHKRADDLLDCYMYGLIIAFGDGDCL